MAEHLLMAHHKQSMAKESLQSSAAAEACQTKGPSHLSRSGRKSVREVRIRAKWLFKTLTAHQGAVKTTGQALASFRVEERLFLAYLWLLSLTWAARTPRGLEVRSKKGHDVSADRNRTSSEALYKE